MNNPVQIRNTGDKTVRLFICARGAKTVKPFDLPAGGVAQLDVQRVELWVHSDGDPSFELPDPKMEVGN